MGSAAARHGRRRIRPCFPLSGMIGVGWVERSETHQPVRGSMMGFAALYPSYGAASHPRYLPLAGNRTLMLSTRFACLSGIRLLDCKSDPIKQSLLVFW